MPLPDFLIVGAQKAGTTSARRNLSAHPDIEMNEPSPDLKRLETHFFNRHWDRGLEWYEALFPETDAVLGEKSPGYFATRRAHARMAETVPKAKLIVLCRHPVDRAFSAWNHLAHAKRRLDPETGKAIPFQEAFEEDRWRIRTHGLYFKHLRSLMRFYPREQIFVGISERVRASLAESYQEMFRFLGVDPDVEIEFGEHHVREYHEVLSPELRRELGEVYAVPNRRLRRMLGESIPEWDDVPR